MTWSCSVGASLTEAAVETRCRACRLGVSDCASRADISVELTCPTGLFPPYLRNSKDISNAPDWNGIVRKPKLSTQEGYSQLKQKVYSFPESTNMLILLLKISFMPILIFYCRFCISCRIILTWTSNNQNMVLAKSRFLNKDPLASLYQI